MIASTNAYNSNPVHGILLGGHANNYRYCDVLSIHYPGANYHYEFFFDEDQNQLFACIHCSHTFPNVLLSKKIEDLFLPLIQPKLHHHGFSIINFPVGGFTKGRHDLNCHVINIPCINNDPNYAEHNANLMTHLIKVTIRHI